MSSKKGFMIGALVVGVGVLGYLYYQETRNNVAIKIELPKVEIQKN